MKYECPRPFLLTMLLAYQPTNKPKLLPISHANVFTANACFEHSNFFTVKIGTPRTAKLIAARTAPRKIQPTPAGVPVSLAQTPLPTTSFLTATTFIYAIGAGITAAAGTRLALQWILAK
jgi:hypothetical protein